MPILVASQISKTYREAETSVEALRSVSLEIEPGEFVTVVGPSGCGKSTLLHICGGMDRPTSGAMTFEGIGWAGLDDEQLTEVRRRRIGFVFQFFNLLPTLTVQENIALPLMLAGMPATEAEARAAGVADRVGLTARLRHFPAQLSGGEAQRAAVARAVVHSPGLVIADEPTGNLDSENGARVLALLVELNRTLGVTILLATHALELTRTATRTFQMKDGVVERTTPGAPMRHDAVGPSI